MIKYDFNPNNLPQALLQAIGLAISSAAQSEALVDEAIASLAGLTHDFGGAITTHMNMSLKSNVLMSLGELRFTDKHDLAELDKIVVEVEEAFKKRNSLAHDQWARNPANDSVGQILESARSHYDVRLIESSTAEITATATELYQVGLRLFQFIKSKGLLVNLPDHPRLSAHKDNAERRAFRKKPVVKVE